MTEFADAAIVFRRPHFRLEDGGLFFLISRRPAARLTAHAAAVWEAIDGRASVGDIRRRIGEHADAALRGLLDLEACEVGEAKFPLERPRILVIEPHCDDAVLSVGGTMWLRRHRCEFVVATIASRSNFSSYYLLDRDFFDVDRVVALRDAEGSLTTRLLGGRYRGLGQADAPLRYRDGNWSLEWYRQHRHAVSAATHHHPGDGVLEAWTDAVRTLLRDEPAGEVWIPLGGQHTDHQLARDACLAALIAEPATAGGRVVRMYQEVPYAARHPDYTAIVVRALEAAGAKLTSETIAIDAAFAEKLRLTSLFGSQFKLDAMREGIEAAARQAGDGATLAERFWRVERLPDAIDPLGWRVDAPEALQLAARLAPWLDRHRAARLVRMLMLVPSGCWSDDMRHLLDCFPQSEFEVYASPPAAAEAADAPLPRVRVIADHAGPKAWLSRSLRLAFRRPAPTLFMAGAKRQKAARALAKLWPFSDTLVVPTLDRVVLALKLLAPGDVVDGGRRR